MALGGGRSRTMRLILAGDAKGLNRTFQRAQTRSKGFGASMKRASGVAAKAFAGIAVAGAAMALKFGASLLRTGDALDKMNRRTGISVERIQELDFAAQQSGTSIESVEKAFLRSSRVVSDASNGLATAKRTLEGLGLTIEEVEATHPDKLFTLFADAIAGVEDPTKRAALAQELFGRSGTELLPLLEDGAAGVEKLAAQARDAGNIMSEETARAAAEFNDELNILKQRGMAVIQRAFTSLAPQLKNIVSFLQRLIERAQEMGPAIKIAGVAIGGLIVALTAAKVATLAFNAVLAINPFVALGIALVAVGIAVYKFRDQVAAAFGWIVERVGAAVATQLRQLADLADGINTVTDKIAKLLGFDGTDLGGDKLRQWADNVEAATAEAGKWLGDLFDKATEGAETMTGTVASALTTMGDGWRAHTTDVVETVTAGGDAIDHQWKLLAARHGEHLEGMYTATVEAWAASHEAARVATTAMGRTLATAFGAAQRKSEAAAATAIGAFATAATIGTSEINSAIDAFSTGTTTAAEDACASLIALDECGRPIFRSLADAADDAAADIATSLDDTATRVFQYVDELGNLVDDFVAGADATAAFPDTPPLPPAPTTTTGGDYQVIHVGGYSLADLADHIRRGALPPGSTLNPGGPGSGYRVPLDEWRRHLANNAPRLAGGGVVTRPTLAVVGEAGPEAVVPLDRYRRGRGPGGDGPGGDLTANLILDGDRLGRWVIKRVNEGLRRGEINVDATIT